MAVRRAERTGRGDLGTLWGRLLATTALTAALALHVAPTPASAQDATWLTNPGSGNYNDGANWTGGSVPTGTATFGVSNVNVLTLSSDASVSGWTFNAGSANYTFSTNGHALTFNGAGINILGGGSDIDNTNNGTLIFTGNSTAGNASITNNAGGGVDFSDTTGPHNDGKISAGVDRGRGQR